MAPEAGHQVCVVDDDASVRNAVKRLLRAAHYTVEAFSSASEFLASGAGDTCGCAILDARMPGMDGIALREKLSALGSRLPVIFLTALDEARIEEKAMKNGALHYFDKTVSGRELLDAVRAAVDGGNRRFGCPGGKKSAVDSVDRQQEYSLTDYKSNANY